MVCPNWTHNLGFQRRARPAPFRESKQASPRIVPGRSPPLFALDLTLWFFYIRAVHCLDESWLLLDLKL